MKNAIILHGVPNRQEYYDPAKPSMSNAHWIPWLQGQLLKHDIEAATPEVPYAYNPKWELWLKEVERYDIGPDTALVGHSTGGGFWVRYLSERPDLKVGKVILVAPWLDPDGDETDGFFDFEVDGALASRTQGLIVFNSDNDMGNIHKSVAIIRDRIADVGYREFHKYGHFTSEDTGSNEFPELLEALLEKK